jgi:ribosomal protein RSM22 (predicted rRNA methylase)
MKKKGTRPPKAERMDFAADYINELVRTKRKGGGGGSKANADEPLAVVAAGGGRRGPDGTPLDGSAAVTASGEGEEDVEGVEEGELAEGEEDEGVDEEDAEFAQDDARRGVNAWMRNPYADAVHTYSKRSINPPAALARGVDAVLKGRNIAALNTHWLDMMASLKARNVSLMHSVAAKASLEAAHQAGALGDVPRSAANMDSPPILYGPNESLSHVLHGVYPSFGVASRILTELADAVPSWAPASMLDFGSGPGTAVLAAKAVWPDTLFDVVIVEPSRSMSQVAEHLLADTPGVMFRRSMDEVARFHRGKKFDLVVAHYALGQLSSDKEREVALTALWECVAPGGSLVLSEHGDRWGFHVVRLARDQVLQRAAALASFLPQLRADAALGRGRAGAGVDVLASGSGSLALPAAGEEGDDDSAAFDFPEGEGEEEFQEEADFLAARRTKGAASLSKAYDSQVKRAEAIRAGSSVPTSSADLGRLESTWAPPIAGVTGKGISHALMAGTGVAATRPPLPHASDVKALLKAYARSHEDSLAGGRMLRAPSEPELGVAVVGPCPHAHACPMPGNSWCHFSQAVARHRKAGRSVHTRGLPARVEKFSYISMRKTDDVTALEHPPHTRAGWQGSGAFSFAEATLAGGGEGEEEGEEARPRRVEGKGKGGQISAFSAGLGGKTAGAAVLQMAQRGLEPDRWWLDNRPGKGSEGAAEEAKEAEGGRGISAAEAVRAAGLPRASAPPPGYAKPGARRRPFSAEEADNPLYAILDAAAEEAAESRSAPNYHAEAAGEFAADDGSDAARVADLEAAVNEAIAAGLPGSGQWSRLVRAPLRRSGHVLLDVCTPQGTFERRVASKGKLKDSFGAYRASRRASWGGQWPNWLARRRDSEPAPGWLDRLGMGLAQTATGILEAGVAALPLLSTPAKSEEGEGARRPPRDRSLQQRPTRRARRRASIAMSMDASSLVTSAERSKAGYAMRVAESMGSESASGAAAGGVDAVLGRARRSGGEEGSGEGVDLSTAAGGAEDVLAGLGAARRGTARGSPMSPLDAAVASQFRDGRIRGIDASAVLSKKPGVAAAAAASGKFLRKK